MSGIQVINSFSQTATASTQEGSGPHLEHRETPSLMQERILQLPALPHVHTHHNSSSNPKGGSRVNEAKRVGF